MPGKFNNILETIGRTPVVKINKLAPAGVNLYVKVESFNPMGSVKDRLALGIIEDAEKTGALKPGQTVIEATSGNTGIGLAMVCAQKGYPLVVTMAENFSVERRRMMRFLGAKVVLTPAAQKGTGMLAKAFELAKQNDWFLCRQFENEANAQVHSDTTAVEILNDFEQDGLDYWVTGFGTGGTFKGVSRVLKKQSPKTKVVICEPENAPMLASGVQQPRADDGQPSSHPSFKPHVMQGWSPDFISKLAEDAQTQNLADDIIAIADQDALKCAKDLAQKEGIFVGISAGATLAGALKLAQTVPAGSNILCMLPDTGERYLSTPLFQDIGIDMNEEELAISNSTVVEEAEPA
ncbi:MAG: cysteine synthase A [Algicola sp.]|nr:cysteine synthase A [Algicola sp.]